MRAMCLVMVLLCSSQVWGEELTGSYSMLAFDLDRNDGWTRPHRVALEIEALRDGRCRVIRRQGDKVWMGVGTYRSASKVGSLLDVIYFKAGSSGLVAKLAELRRLEDSQAIGGGTYFRNRSGKHLESELYVNRGNYWVETTDLQRFGRFSGTIEVKDGLPYLTSARGTAGIWGIAPYEALFKEIPGHRVVVEGTWVPCGHAPDEPGHLWVRRLISPWRVNRLRGVVTEKGIRIGRRDLPTFGSASAILAPARGRPVEVAGLVIGKGPGAKVLVTGVWGWIREQTTWENLRTRTLKRGTRVRLVRGPDELDDHQIWAEVRSPGSRHLDLGWLPAAAVEIGLPPKVQGSSPRR